MLDAHISGADIDNTTNTTTYPTLGGITVSAVNNSSIAATSSTEVAIKEGGAYSFILVFNTIGYQAQNLLFNTLDDAIIGSDELGDAFGDATSASTSASITNSDIDATGSVEVAATTEGAISAVTGAETKSKATNTLAIAAKFGKSGLSAGGLVAMNKVSTSAKAFIEDRTRSRGAPPRWTAPGVSRSGVRTPPGSPRIPRSSPSR